MKRLSLLLVLVLCLPLTSRADEASRRVKAQEFVTLLHMDTLMQQMMDTVQKQASAMALQVSGDTPTPQQQALRDDFNKKAFALVESRMGWKVLEPDILDLYARNFTDEELDAILAFYKSPAGVSMIAKTPTISAQSSQIAQARMTELMPELNQMVLDFAKAEKDAEAAVVAPGKLQQSQWVHPSANGRLIYHHDKNGVTIPDYSFAGYRSGGVALPTVPAQIELLPTGADDTATIQHAIDTVSARPLDAKGFRGAVQLGPGVFHCSAALTIAASGVVLRGAGSSAGHEATTIDLAGDPHVGIIIKGNFALNTISPATNITDAYVPFGAHTVHVTDAKHIHPGDLVQITKPVTAAWIEYMGMSGLERPDRDEHWISAKALNVRRLVTAVSGNAVTFQIALMDSYDSQFLGTEHFTVQPVAVSGQVKEVGVEDLRIVAPAVSVGFHDAHTIAMEINAAADSWVRNVAMIDTTEGVRMDFNSERITLTRVDVEQSKTITSSAKPFHFAINGTQVLVDRATGTGDSVTYFATEPRQQGPVVILNSVFHGDGNLEPHQRWSTGLLVDNCSVPDGGIHFINRGTMGSGHGWTIGWGVVWNSTASNFIIQQAPGTITWAMGNRGPLKSQGMPDSNGGRVHGTPLPSGIIESQGKPVTPQSLYLSQLAERLGPKALKNIGYTTADPLH